jgi:hypothetical protein
MSLIPEEGSNEEQALAPEEAELRQKLDNVTNILAKHGDIISQLVYYELVRGLREVSVKRVFVLANLCYMLEASEEDREKVEKLKLIAGRLAAAKYGGIYSVSLPSFVFEEVQFLEWLRKLDVEPSKKTKPLLEQQARQLTVNKSEGEAELIKKAVYLRGFIYPSLEAVANDFLVFADRIILSIIFKALSAERGGKNDVYKVG